MASPSPAVAGGGQQLPALKLRVRGPAGDLVVTSGVTRGSTLADLKRLLQERSGIPTPLQQLSSTYPPPARVLAADDSATLESLRIQSNDTLLLKQMEAPPAAARASGRPTSPPKPKPASLESLAHLEALRVVPIPDDNSCMFNAIGFLMEGAHSPALMTEMRETVAAVILADANGTYDEAFLGCSKEAYAKVILKRETWGGGIELAILADFYNVEIASFDVESAHLYLFGVGDTPASRKDKRIFVIYSGVHYDALVDGPDNTSARRVFQADDETTTSRALKAARVLQGQGAFTNVNSFSLRCSVCQSGIVGAVEAQAHAQATGHAQFEEYAK